MAFFLWLYRVCCAWDKTCIEIVETTLDFLSEWWSITQKQVERTLAATYVGTLLLEACMERNWKSSSVLLFWGGFVGLMLFMQMKSPPAVRKRNRETGPLGRVLASQGLMVPLVLLGFLSLAEPPKQVVQDLCETIRPAAYIAFEYVLIANVTGDKGRRRKLALAKLKELFGSEWIPEPNDIRV